MIANQPLDEVAAELDLIRAVPDHVLGTMVVRDGACMRLYAGDAHPPWINEPCSDRELAAQVCAGCSLRAQCLELELRTAGAATVGVWGALNETDRRRLYPLWVARRATSGDGGGR